MSNTTTADGGDCYVIKEIQFRYLRINILLQEWFGPCALLSIANCLLLRGAIDLPRGKPWVSHTALVRILRDYALRINRVPHDATPEVRANIQANVDASIRVLCSSTMRRGVLVNPSLTNVSSFEFSGDLGVFDLFRIPLYHGWVVGPDDEPQLREFFSGRTYNEVQDAICLLQHQYDLSATSAVTREDDEESDNDELGLRTSASRTSMVGTQEQASQAMAWFARHTSQMTEHGIEELERKMGENELTVLYRDSHFWTLIRHEGKLYTLMTAAAYSECHNYVFQSVGLRGQTTAAFDGEFGQLPPQIIASNPNAVSTPGTWSSADARRARVGAEIRDMRSHRVARRKKEEEESKYLLLRQPGQRTRRKLAPSVHTPPVQTTTARRIPARVESESSEDSDACVIV